MAQYALGPVSHAKFDPEQGRGTGAPKTWDFGLNCSSSATIYTDHG